MATRKRHGGDEHDAFSAHRNMHRWQRGELRRIKRKANKRDRRHGKQQANQHDH